MADGWEPNVRSSRLVVVEPPWSGPFEEGDRVRVIECPSRPERVGRYGNVTLRRNLVNGYDYTVRLDGDDTTTGQYRPEWLEPAPEEQTRGEGGDE